MSCISHGENCRQSVARTFAAVERRCVRLNASIKGHAAASTEYVCHDLSTLRVSGQDQLGVRTSIRVRGQLSVTGQSSIVGRLTAQVRVQSRIDEVLITTAGDSIADRCYERALPTRIWFIVAASKEDALRIIERLRNVKAKNEIIAPNECAQDQAILADRNTQNACAIVDMCDDFLIPRCPSPLSGDLKALSYITCKQSRPYQGFRGEQKR